MKKISVRDATEADLLSIGVPRQNTFKYLIGPLFIGTVNDDVVFICGMSIPWNGFGESWLIPGPAIAKYLSAPATVLSLIKKVEKEYHLRRVQAQVLATNTVHFRFCEWLGFVPEYTMTDYGPNGESYILMRRY